MRAPVRFGVCGLALIVVFVVAVVTAGALVPEQASQSWRQDTVETGHPVPIEESPAPTCPGIQNERGGDEHG